MKNDSLWDERLGVSTGGVDYSAEDDNNYGYDPTPYVVLEELIRLDVISKDDVVVDYGCGKGRVGFFLNSQVGCDVIGIDFNRDLIEKAEENLESYGGDGISFHCLRAEDYCPGDVNIFYFFNPFSSGVFSRVLKRIEESYAKNPREIMIFFYYSTIEYRLYLSCEPRLEPVESLEFAAEKIDNEVDARLSVFRFRPLAKD